MKQLHFTVNINADAGKVWDILWEDETYRKWTSAFSKGSYAVSDWNEGSKILFLGPGGDGMYSVIDKKVPGRVMTFRHLGVVKEGKEQPLDEETKKWSGALEDYRLDERNGSTELSVRIDVTDDFANYFDESFPRALGLVKTLSEN